MARPETIETVGGGGNGPLPPHSPYRVPPPLPTGPVLLSTSTSGTSISAPQLHRHHDPLQLFYLTHTQPERRVEPGTRHRSSPTPPPPPVCSRGSVVSPDELSGEQPGSDTEEDQNRSSRRGPLPDLLPQNEHAHRASHPGGPGGPGAQEVELRRVASQLKLIGDEFNATFLRRAHNAPRWQDWRDVCRGLFNFITQTLSALYRLT